MDNSIQKYLSSEFNLDLPAGTPNDQLEMILAQKINHLIENDFSSLVNILYRVDVSEQKLKSLLKQHNDVDAGKIIAALVIERQMEKMRSRQQFRKNDGEINEDEKW